MDRPEPADPPIPESVLAEYAGFVRRIARGLLHEETLAEDVVQQTLLAAVRKPPRRRDDLRAWLARVARNFALKTRTREAAVARRERAVAKSGSVEAAGRQVERAAMLRSVVDAVLALDEPYRDVVLHRYFDGWTRAEIAERTGVPASTVRTRLQRALAQLRGRLDREHDGDRRAWMVPLLATFAGGGPAVPSASTGAQTGTTSTGSIAMASGAKKVAVIAGAALLLGLAAVVWETT